MTALATTRLSLHGVAELVLAGPQYVVSHDVRLQATQGGFGTTKGPSLRVDGTTLLFDGGSVALDGRTLGELAVAAGVEATTLDHVYHDGSHLTPDHLVTLDDEATAELLEAFRIGDEALHAFAPAEERPLWPEHFDIGISLDEVNYGISPGDAHIETPYAYVGPWTPREGSFWNVSFGAARTLAEIGGVEQVTAFFAEGRSFTV